MPTPEPREFLMRVFRAAVAAADPATATRQAVSEIRDLDSPSWVLAVGKGAHGMATGAVQALRERRVQVAGGLVVAHAPDPHATHGLDATDGDHPVPGERSFAAADRLAAVAAGVPNDADAIVLVSGGATSLIASPVDGISTGDLVATFSALLDSGADIRVMNALRKRVLRFGAGRLALSLGARRIHCLIASDVVGNDVPSIASGPCVADTSRASEARAHATETAAWNALPSAVRAHIDAIADGRAPDSVGRDHPRFATTSAKVILDRTTAAAGAVYAATKAGAVVEVVGEPLAGEASTTGARIAQELVSRKRRAQLACVIWTGETTVTVGSSAGKGGRCQELALACAGALESAGDKADGITVLAAGTDGRDGPTDAAGAIVDATTCGAIRNHDIDPAVALQDHSSYDALNSAEALLKTGPTGTNVNDLVITLLS